MNKDRANGAIKDAVGDAEQKAGEFAGDTQLQVEGIAQQAKGIVENTLSQLPPAWRPSGDVHDAQALLDSFRAGSNRIQ